VNAHDVAAERIDGRHAAFVREELLRGAAQIVAASFVGPASFS
jgi:hypothetical protein